MIGELTAQIKGCYRARRWYDLTIEAKNEDTEVGGALQYTALDRILSLEADIARIKVGSTASLIVPVGEYTAPPTGRRRHITVGDRERSCFRLLLLRP